MKACLSPPPLLWCADLIAATSYHVRFFAAKTEHPLRRYTNAQMVPTLVIGRRSRSGVQTRGEPANPSRHSRLPPDLAETRRALGLIEHHQQFAARTVSSL